MTLAASPDLRPAQAGLIPAEYNHPFYGRTFAFPSLLDPKIGITVDSSYQETGANITITQPEHPAITLKLNPLLEGFSFATAWRNNRKTTTGLIGGEISSLAVILSEIQVKKYSDEGAKNVQAATQGNYELVVGKNQAGEMFMDTWPKEATSPALRFSISVEDRKVDLANSRLTLLTQV